MFVTFFITILIGFLGIIFFYDLQSIDSQAQTTPKTFENISVKITSPAEGKKIPSGELTISGISSDTQNKNCIVFVDWNDLKPFQKVRAAGPGGVDDFSEWIYTYDSTYHKIIAGNNELTSKITCLDGSKPLTKWNSINVTGYLKTSSLLPIIQNNTTSLESSSKQVPLKTILPGANQNNNTTSLEHNTTSLQLTNASPDEHNTTSLQLTNASESAVEILIPNESLDDVIDNTTKSISASAQSNSTNATNSNSKQFTLGNARIDLDEQSEAPIDEELDNQTMVTPDNQTMVTPDNQQQQPPTLNNQQQQPPTMGNETLGSTGSRSLEEKSPTEGLFPPFQLPSLFP